MKFFPTRLLRRHHTCAPLNVHRFVNCTLHNVKRPLSSCDPKQLRCQEDFPRLTQHPAAKRFVEQHRYRPQYISCATNHHPTDSARWRKNINNLSGKHGHDQLAPLTSCTAAGVTDPHPSVHRNVINRNAHYGARCSTINNVLNTEYMKL